MDNDNLNGNVLFQKRMESMDNDSSMSECQRAKFEKQIEDFLEAIICAVPDLPEQKLMDLQKDVSSLFEKYIF